MNATTVAVDLTKSVFQLRDVGPRLRPHWARYLFGVRIEMPLFFAC